MRGLLGIDGCFGAVSGWDGKCVVRLMAADGWPLRRQIDTTYRGADYDLITALSPEAAPDRIEFRLDTRRARSELRSVHQVA